MDPKNWRPISLPNAYYKIASRAIAGRLLKVLHAVVDKDHTCGVPGWFIGENVAYQRDVADYASQAGAVSHVPSYLWIRKKAFDRVDWGFMTDTLSTMGLVPPLSAGSIFFIGARRVLSMLMVTFLPIFPCHVGSSGLSFVAPSLRYGG